MLLHVDDGAPRVRGKFGCRWTISPCWLRSLRDFLIPLGATWALVAGFAGLFLRVQTNFSPLGMLLALVLALVMVLLTAGFVVVWRCCLYLGSDFMKWLNERQGHVVRSERQEIDARLRNFRIKALFDRPSRDYKRLKGLHTEKKLAQLLAEFPGIAYVDASGKTSHPAKYFLDYCARFMLRTSQVDFYWLARLQSIAGATVRLYFEQGRLIVNVLSPNAELERAIQRASDNLTIEGSLIEVSVSPSWLRVRIIGGTW